MTFNPQAFGAQLQADGGTLFRLWAPSAPEVSLLMQTQGSGRRLSMQRNADGWHQLRVAEAGAGTRYQFAIGDAKPVPDPASRYNPLDVHGPSEVVDPRGYTWRDTAWRGRPWHEAVIYELHIGAFTPEGTFAAAGRKLATLAELGITAVELMPLADTPGTRNWGYDGVLPFAPDAAYGKPDELKEFIDQAHGLGLMVLLDVVYNHFGPDGNDLHVYCPEFFNPLHQTPWGAAINFDGPSNAPVRQFFVENALYWTEEFHFDGLRLDAVHQIHDDSPRPITREIAERLHAGPGRERHVHLVLENELNQASPLARDASAQPRWATAQWNDDLHHSAHVLLTGETDGYYEDFTIRPAESLARAMAQGFVYQGQPSAHRDGAHRGEPSAHLPPTAFVSFLQNHDQVGNRALGQRIGALTNDSSADRLAALYACLLLSPHIPMLFMGEEFAASTPFLYFCDFHGELAEAVANGRRAEFARFKAFADEAAQARIPDPNAAETFAQSKLRWEEANRPPHRARLQLVRSLLALRRHHLVPRLAGAAEGGAFRSQGGLVRVEWMLGGGTPWHLVANLGSTPVETGPPPEGFTVYTSGEQTSSPHALVLAPNAVRVVLVGVPPSPETPSGEAVSR